MHLHGSEYWTYFLPRRVGEEVAQDWMSKMNSPISALEAHRKGFVDEIVGTDFNSCDSVWLYGYMGHWVWPWVRLWVWACV